MTFEAICAIRGRAVTTIEFIFYWVWAKDYWTKIGQKSMYWPSSTNSIAPVDVLERLSHCDAQIDYHLSVMLNVAN